MNLSVEKSGLFQRGLLLIMSFCDVNRLPRPVVTTVDPIEWYFAACAYYRYPEGIKICLPKCGSIGVAGPAWSYPGYIADRTPYGVLAHELGHHVDYIAGQTKGKYFSEFGSQIRKLSGEKRLTSYAPNDAEWFAEMFRLFITNPELLHLIRPKTYWAIVRHYNPVEARPWYEVLQNAPRRTYDMAVRRINEAAE